MNGSGGSISSGVVGKQSAFLEFVGSGSREALDRLVREHIDFVYAAAQRQVGNPHLAEDVTQAVFLVLARRGRSIRSESALAGWLFKTVLYAAANAIKMERRRRKHERAAAGERSEVSMPQTTCETDPLVPMLNDAIADLGRCDRDAVLLRHFRGLEMKEVGALLGVSEIAARKRVARGVERLRKEFARRGVSARADVMGATLVMAAKQRAPGHLAGTIASASGGAAGPGAVGIAHGVLRTLGWIHAKVIALYIIAIIVVPGVVMCVRGSMHQAAVRPVVLETKRVIAAATQPDESKLDVVCVDPGGKPVVGAEVYLNQSMSGPGGVAISNLGPVRTDAFGHVRFVGLPTIQGSDLGMLRRIYARVPGKWVGFDTEGWRRRQDKLPVVEVLSLSPPTVIHGRVEVPAGDKAQPALIHTRVIWRRGEVGEILHLQRSPGDKFLTGIYDVPVGADGTFTLGDVLSSADVVLECEARRSAYGQSDVIESGTGPEPVIPLRPQAVIRGRVWKPDGTWAGGITITARPLGNEQYFNHDFSSVSDVDGRYAIEHLPGIYVGLFVAGKDFVLPMQGIRLNSGDIVDRDLQLETGAVISGRVTDSGGNGLEDAEISAGNVMETANSIASATSDRGGNYRMRVPAGKINVYIQEATYGFEVPKKPEDRQRVITIPAGAVTVAGPIWKLSEMRPQLPYAKSTVQGRIVDAKGRGVGHISLQDDRVEDWGTQMMPVSDPDAGETDAEGRYHFEVGARISHKLSASSDDFDHPVTRTVTPKPDEVVTFGDLVVHPRPILGTISGIVSDPKGRALEGVSADVGDRFTSLSDAQGRFTLPVRSRGAAVLELMKSGYKVRNWNDIPVGAKDVRLLLYPNPERGPDDAARPPMGEAKSLTHQHAPGLHVDWIFSKVGHPPVIGGGDGKMMVIAFCWEMGDAKRAVKFASDLVKVCEGGDALPILIYTPESTEAGVRAVFGDHVPAAEIGIDQYWGDACPGEPTGMTAGEYEVVERPMVFVVSGDGTVVRVQKGVKGVEKYLGN